MRNFLTTRHAGAFALSASLAVIACGGGSSTPAPAGNPTAPTNVVAGSIGATISLTANGPVPADVRIEPTQRVRIVNNDTRPHQINTNPHNFHTDCPANNSTVLNPGQSFDTAVFNDAKPCGYHDHLLPDEQKFWGLIRVGTTDDTKGPVYSRGW